MMAFISGAMASTVHLSLRLRGFLTLPFRRPGSGEVRRKDLLGRITFLWLRVDRAAQLFCHGLRAASLTKDWRIGVIDQVFDLQAEKIPHTTATLCGH